MGRYFLDTFINYFLINGYTEFHRVGAERHREQLNHPIKKVRTLSSVTLIVFSVNLSVIKNIVKNSTLKLPEEFVLQKPVLL